MRWFIWIILSLVSVVGLIALTGYFLPVGHEASRSADFSRSPEVVFALIADLPNYPSWWDGASVKSEIVESQRPSRLVTRVVGETQFGGTWTFDIAPTPTGSRVTITERGEVYNVVFRTLSRFVLGHTSTMDSYLEAARSKLN
jgi:hypothetical protein